MIYHSTSCTQREFRDVSNDGPSFLVVQLQGTFIMRLEENKAHI